MSERNHRCPRGTIDVREELVAHAQGRTRRTVRGGDARRRAGKAWAWRGWRDGGRDAHPHFAFARQAVFVNHHTGATLGIASSSALVCDIAELRVPDIATVDPARDGFGLVSGSGQRDLLSELLANVRLNGDRIIAYAPSAGFSISFEGTGALHIVEDGELELVVPVGEHVERVRRGDVVLLPRGDPHQMRDAVGADVPVGKPPRWLSGTFRIGDSEASPCSPACPKQSCSVVPATRRSRGSR